MLYVVCNNFQVFFLAQWTDVWTEKITGKGYYRTLHLGSVSYLNRFTLSYYYPIFFRLRPFYFFVFPHLSEICFWTALGRWLNQTLKTFQAENCKKTWCCWMSSTRGSSHNLVKWVKGLWRSPAVAITAPGSSSSLSAASLSWFFFFTVLKFLEFQTSDRTCVWCPTSQKGVRITVSAVSAKQQILSRLFEGKSPALWEMTDKIMMTRKKRRRRRKKK